MVMYNNEIRDRYHSYTQVDLENIGYQALELVNRWVQENGLRVALHKLEVVILSKKWEYRNPILH